MKKLSQELQNRTFTIHMFRFKLLVTIITLINVNNVYSQKEINFSYKGHLISSPPVELKTEEDLKFVIYFDESFRGNHITKILDRYFETYDGVRKLIDSEGGKLKLDDIKLKIILKELVFEINSILKNFPKTSFKNWNTYDEKRVKKGIDPKETPNAGYTFQYVPLHSEFLNKKFVIQINEFNNENILLKAPKEIPINLIEDNFNIANDAQDTKKVQSIDWNLPFKKGDKTTHKIHESCSKIIYELREVNPYYDYINKLNFQSFNAAIKNLIADQKFKDSKKYIKDYKDWKTKFVDVNGKLKLAELRTQIAAIDIHNKAINFNSVISNNVTLKEWILNGLWLTNGTPKLHPISLHLEKRDLQEQKKKLEKLNALIGEYDRLLNNDALGIIDFDGMKDYNKSISALRLEQKNLQKKVNVADKKYKQKQFYSRYDALLYHGELFISGTVKYVMHHHDARNGYLIWPRARLKEIPEDNNLLVLVENEKVNTKLDVNLTVTEINSDLSQLSEDAQLSVAEGDYLFVTNDNQSSTENEGELSKAKKDFSSDPNKDKLIEFLAKYYKLISQINIYPKASTYLFQIPKKESKKPNLISKPIPHEKPVTAPAKIEYTISQNTGSEPKELWKGEYRNNRLYKVRLKAGFIYSQFERSDFTINTDSLGVVSVDTTQTRHGVDGTFGIQYYPWKRDIRKSGQWEPVLYLGFSMREPLKNLYTGVGVEPISGLTLMGGLHLSETEAIKIKEGVPIGTEPKWKVNNVFFSVLVDVVFFKNLFGSKSLLD